MVPSRMVTKVPSSISALPPMSSSPLQVLRQDSVFDRAEEGGGRAGEEQHHQMHEGVLEPQAERTEDHGSQIEELDAAREHGLVELVGQLTGDGREQEVGQHEQRRAGLHEERGVPAMPHRQVEGDEDGDAVAQARCR